MPNNRIRLNKINALIANIGKLILFEEDISWQAFGDYKRLQKKLYEDVNWVRYEIEKG